MPQNFEFSTELRQDHRPAAPAPIIPIGKLESALIFDALRRFHRAGGPSGTSKNGGKLSWTAFWPILARYGTAGLAMSHLAFRDAASI